MERIELTLEDMGIAMRTRLDMKSDHDDYLVMLGCTMRASYRKEYRGLIDRMKALLLTTEDRLLTDDETAELKRTIRRLQMFEHRQLVDRIA